MKKIVGSTLVIAMLLVGCGSDGDGGLSEDNRVILQSNNLFNDNDTFAPKISYMEVIGNRSPQNGQAVISKSSNGGEFSYQVVLKDEIYTNRVYSGLNDGTDGMVLEYEMTMGKVFDFNCQLNRIASDEQEGVDYTCNNVRMQNMEGNNSTYIVVTVCNDTEEKCSTAGIPVLFVE